VRFPLATFDRLEGFVGAVQDAAGRAVDIDDPDDLDHLLFTELELPRPRGKGYDESSRPTDPLPVDWGEPAPDPLESLREAHPVMPPLLEYRRLEASTPRLGDRTAFRQALEGEGLYAVGSVTFVLQGRD
jgi:DNA polymerase I-like protein with 3'-5' exonuclease and polymerase domains